MARASTARRIRTTDPFRAIGSSASPLGHQRNSSSRRRCSSAASPCFCLLDRVDHQRGSDGDRWSAWSVRTRRYPLHSRGRSARRKARRSDARLPRRCCQRPGQVVCESAALLDQEPALCARVLQFIELVQLSASSLRLVPSVIPIRSAYCPCDLALQSRYGVYSAAVSGSRAPVEWSRRSMLEGGTPGGD